MAILPLFLGGCVSDDGLLPGTGTIHLSMSKVSTDTETRATPAELGKPLSNEFTLKIQRQHSDYVAYNGGFTDNLQVRVGSYDITATLGEDVIIGKDTPYYIGTATANVQKDQTTNVSLPCKVGNSLVSVRFGKDETERARFDRFYADYGLLVEVGDYSMPILSDEEECSIYFKAGSSPVLIFYGRLKDDGNRLVYTQLSHSSLPAVFQAAEHAIVTLSLPDPESILAVNIGKVELETVTLDETIPLSWLPVATVTPVHQYDENQILQGTDLIFSSNYPGMTWEARVTNSAGTIVRTVVGTGSLCSDYKTAVEWPFLPAGKYKATYYLHTQEGINKVSSREFMIANPELKAFVGGFTSYDMYLDGDIETANKTGGNTFTEPSVSVGIASSLAQNENYTLELGYTFNGQRQMHSMNENIFRFEPLELAASKTPYTLTAHASFCGVQVSASRDFIITGVPVTYAPPKEEDGWSPGTDYISFEDSYVRMGLNAWAQTQRMSIDRLAVPQGTRVTLDYNVVIHPATMGTTFSCWLGDDEMLKQEQAGGALNMTDYTHSGNTTITTSAFATTIKCENSYGLAQTRTDVYKIALQYGK